MSFIHEYTNTSGVSYQYVINRNTADIEVKDITSNGKFSGVTSYHKWEEVTGLENNTLSDYTTDEVVEMVKEWLNDKDVPSMFPIVTDTGNGNVTDQVWMNDTATKNSKLVRVADMAEIIGDDVNLESYPDLDALNAELLDFTFSTEREYPESLVHLVRFRIAAGETYDWEIVTTKEEDQSTEDFDDYTDENYHSDAVTGYHIVTEEDGIFTLYHSGDDVTDKMK